MKFIRKIRYMFVIGLMLFMTIISNINVFASEKTWQESYLNVFASEKTWQESYLEVIDTQLKDDSSNYLLCYIDNDEIPELYMWDNVHHFYSLYTYYGECNRWSEKESMWIYNNKSGYFWSTYSTNAAYQYNIFYKLENGSCNEIYSFCIDMSEMPTEKYLINDEDVGKEEYERKMAELESEYPLSSEFQINGRLDQTYDEIRQYLLDSIESENNNKTDEPITTETTETENITDEPTTTETAKTENIPSNEEISTNVNYNTKRVSSPKTGDSEPIFCELIVIGFITASTIMLIRKKYKSN